MAKRTARSPWPLILIGGGMVLLVAALATLLTGQQPQAASLPLATAAPDIPFPDVPRISVADAKAGYDAGSILFVDVRSAGSYAESHIPGAESLPETGDENAFLALPHDTEIVTYCT